MAKSTRSGKAKAKPGRGEWCSVELNATAPEEKELLDLSGKADSIDHGKQGLRGKRFTDSYLTGTNGGSSFEFRTRQPLGGQLISSSATESRPPAASAQGRGTPALQNVIGGSDERTIVDDTSLIPARSIGLLTITAQNGEEFFGTAWMIGPRVLATAAHNLVSPSFGQAKSITVHMAYNGQQAMGGSHKIRETRISQAWLNDPGAHNPHDFAILRIDDPNIGNSLGWIGFADYEDSKFRSLALNVFGYPMDLRDYYMYYGPGRTSAVDEYRLYFSCDAGPGMSGGPIIANFGTSRIAVGIHVAGGASANVGTRIDEDVYEMFSQYQNW